MDSGQQEKTVVKVNKAIYNDFKDQPEYTEVNDHGEQYLLNSNYSTLKIVKNER